MAGHGQKTDPAIERWADMRENVYRNFKFTPTVVKRAVALGIVVPGLIYVVAVDQNYKWNLTGTRKGESLRRDAQAQSPSTSD
ncbi:hypothetical protein AURDEDRAFT_157959 [Auricularia subglabra TFB-10046 SS5]|nr:hypothetical protein AURDEDRAFT_157959 [Auricularia subglabra TFB-10046 SS5]